MGCYSQIGGTLTLISSNNAILRSISREIGMTDSLENADSPERKALDAKIEEVRDFLATSKLGPTQDERYQAELQGSLSIKIERDRESEEHPDNAKYQALIKEALELCRKAGTRILMPN